MLNVVMLSVVAQAEPTAILADDLTFTNVTMVQLIVNALNGLSVNVIQLLQA